MHGHIHDCTPLLLYIFQGEIHGLVVLLLRAGTNQNKLKLL